MEHVENFWVDMPEPKEPKIITECSHCGIEMYEGETYYKIGNSYYCDNCVDIGVFDDEEEEEW